MKKNKFQYLVFYPFLVLLTALTFYCLFSGRIPSSGYALTNKKNSAFPRFKVQDVSSIRISWQNTAATLVRQEGNWFIEERGFLPASGSRIHNFLSALSTVSPVKELHNSTQEIRKRLHLTEDSKDKASIPGVRVTLQDTSRKEIASFLLGKGHFLRPEAGSPHVPHPEGRYVLINGRIYLLPLVFEDCHPVPASWVKPIQLRELQKSLTMSAWKLPAAGTKPQTLFQVYRRSTAHPFTLAYPKGKLADNKILSGIAAELSKPFTGDYFTGNRSVLSGKETVILLIRCADGFSYRLQITAHDAQTDVLSLKVFFEPEKILRIAGETPEDFTSRKNALQKRFEEENFYSEGKFFLTGKRLRNLLMVQPVREGKAAQKAVGTRKK